MHAIATNACRHAYTAQWTLQQAAVARLSRFSGRLVSHMHYVERVLRIAGDQGPPGLFYMLMLQSVLQPHAW